MGLSKDSILRKFKDIISPAFNEWLIRNGYYSAPAGMKYHGAYEGGLVDHSIEVTKTLLEFDREWEREESPYIVGMLHDICKIDSYEIVGFENGAEEYQWNKDTLYMGHGDKSLMILSSHILLTDEEAACIRYHMGAFTDKEEWNYYTRAVRKYPNVLFTHTADMIASHVKGV